MSGTTDVTVTLRLGTGAAPGRRRYRIGDDVVVVISVRRVSGSAPVAGVTGLAALYWLPGTVDHQGPAQPLEAAVVSPGDWRVVVPTLIPGTYTVWSGILAPVRKTAWIAFDVSSDGLLTLTSTGTVPWGPLEAVAAAAGSSAAAHEARRVVDAEVGGLDERIAALETAPPGQPAPTLTAVAVAKALGLPLHDFSDARNSALLTL